MPIEVRCPKCGKVANFSDSAAGRNARCRCGTALKVPGPSPAPRDMQSKRPVNRKGGLGLKEAAQAAVAAQAVQAAASKPTCPECAMEVPPQAKLCPFCGCMFTQEERKDLICIAIEAREQEELKAKHKQEMESVKLETRERGGKHWGFWLTILIPFSSGVTLLVLLIIFIIGQCTDTARTKAAVHGVWLGFVKAFWIMAVFFGTLTAISMSPSFQEALGVSLFLAVLGVVWCIFWGKKRKMKTRRVVGMCVVVFSLIVPLVFVACVMYSRFNDHTKKRFYGEETYGEWWWSDEAKQREQKKAEAEHRKCWVKRENEIEAERREGEDRNRDAAREHREWQIREYGIDGKSGESEERRRKLEKQQDQERRDQMHRLMQLEGRNDDGTPIRSTGPRLPSIIPEAQRTEEEKRRQEQIEAERAAVWAGTLGLPKEQTLDLGNGVKLELVIILAGKFMMGSPKTDKDRDRDETQHEVTISKAFCMGKYEVTQEQYETVIGRNPSSFKGPKNPVEAVSWDDAQAFCKMATAKTGKVVRLPTEAEWEYACRAGTTTTYYTGVTEADLERAAWYSANCKYKTHPVGQKEPNSWCLYDMHGNVGEWCNDWRENYPKGVLVDPHGPAQGTLRVFRGGSLTDGPAGCRSASRPRAQPSQGHINVGFRVVVTVARTP